MEEEVTDWNHVIVHDGRMGRDPALVVTVGDKVYGEVLMEYDTDVPLSIGEHLTLPDGITVVVLGYDEMPPSSVSISRAFIGNLA